MTRTRRDILRALSGLGALAVGASTPAAASGCRGVPEWIPDVIYTEGDQATYTDEDLPSSLVVLWEAKWWTKGDEPGTDGEWGPWKIADVCVSADDLFPCDVLPVWESDAEYEVGDLIVHDDAIWLAQRPPRDAEPGGEDWGPWEQVEQCFNRTPVARFSVSPSRPEPDEEVTFDASESTDFDGDSLSYEWAFGDDTTATGDVVTHAFTESREYDVELTVSDGRDQDTASQTVTVRPQRRPRRVIATYKQWAQYERDYLPADIPYDQITHAQYAYAEPAADGSISLLGDSHAHQAFWEKEDWWGVEGGTFAELAEQYSQTDFVLAIGGWAGSIHFSDAASDQQRRQQFADDCITWIKRGNLDGITLDWRYPTGLGCTSDAYYCDGDIVHRESDPENFTKLCRAVRDRLDEAEAQDDARYELSATLSGRPEIAEQLEHAALSDVLDYVNVLTLDYRGIGSIGGGIYIDRDGPDATASATGHHAPLSANPDDVFPNADSWNVTSVLSWYEEQGWEPSQLTMAQPTYGRSWDEVQKPPSDGFGNGRDDGLFQLYSGEGEDASGEGSFPTPGDGGSDHTGIWEYFDLGGDGREQTNPVDLSADAWETHFDETATAAWSYNADDGLVISHPTEQSVRKRMEWLADIEYGGTMVWGISGDTKDHRLLEALTAPIDVI